MCEKQLPEKIEQRSKPHLTTEGSLIPEDWEPTPELKKIMEMAQQLRAALGPTLVQEIVDEFITTNTSTGKTE